MRSRVFGPLPALALASGIVCALFAGCARTPPTLPITGIVRYQGKPVKKATVGFVSPHPENGRPLPAVGTTDAEGRFTLATRFSPRSSPGGVVEGKHHVVVQKWIPANGMTEEEYERRAAAGEQIEMMPLFDEKYFSSDTTPLSAEVHPGGVLDFDFEIK
jgi:hypothetical protein